MPFVQKGRLLSLDTPLGSDVLLVRGFSGWEAISAPFQLDLDVASENDALDLRGLLGGNVTLHIALTGESVRHWNGRVSKITQASRDHVFTSYQLEVVPWFTFLRLRQDCRIFQDKTVQEIATDVFSALNFQDFEFRIHGDLPKRDYCVQYRETDFHFVSRLLEEEGIFYFFEHESGRHTMVLANTPEAHTACPEQGIARCLQSSGGTREEDVVTSWHRNEEFLTSSVATTDYNFQTPATSLLISLDGNGPYGMYDYPGIYQRKQLGENLARIRLEEISTAGSVIEGASTCRAFASGYRFQLQDHYRHDWNSDYVLTEIHHSAAQGSDYHSGSIDSSGETSYDNHFKCIPLSVSFRPLRGTARPIMMGCQTAVVVGPSGEEIFTDQFGRVKVQFHWDRLGQHNEQSSCWIRVAQSWAGKNWGSIAIPRIGQEVIVDFLEGNPDRPIVIGSVYNADQMPPYPLPAGAVNMGFKSKSVHGSGYNEISINDTNTTEGITIHAQHDMTSRVENDESISIGHDRTEHVGKNETLTINVLRTHNVGLNDMLNVGGGQEVSVGGAQAISVGLVRAVTVGLSQNTHVGKNYSLEAGDSIVLKTGSSSITLKKDGTITIEGKNISIIGSEHIAAQSKTIDMN